MTRKKSALDEYAEAIREALELAADFARPCACISPKCHHKRARAIIAKLARANESLRGTPREGNQ